MTGLRTKVTLAFLAGALAIGTAWGIALAVPLFAAKPSVHNTVSKAVWMEIEWPFPIDQFGTGKAFACRAANCGADIKIFLRAKIGFCNCTTGVADDDELDRVGDLGLIGAFKAQSRGEPIQVGPMNGRSRSLTSSRQFALSVAFADRCDVAVATAIVDRDPAFSIQPVVLEFLNRPETLAVIEKALSS